MEDLNGVTKKIGKSERRGWTETESQSSVVGMHFNYEQLETRLTVMHRGTG